MLRSASSTAVLVLLAAAPSLADAITPPPARPAETQDGRDRRDGVRPPPPPLCDDVRACDGTRPFRFKGGMSF